MVITSAAQVSGEALVAARVPDEQIAAIVSPIMDVESRKMSTFEMEVASARLTRAAVTDITQEIERRAAVDLTLPKKFVAVHNNYLKLSVAVREMPQSVGNCVLAGGFIGGVIHPLVLLGGFMAAKGMAAGDGGSRGGIALMICGFIVSGIGFLLGGFLTVGVGALVGAIVGAVKKAVYNHDKKHVDAVEAQARPPVRMNVQMQAGEDVSA